ncbi:MAG: hypothetical protein ABIP51_05750, partial [Bacteroidia bacterium]
MKKNYFKTLIVAAGLILTQPTLNAQTWSLVGTGMSGDVNSTVVFNAELYAGGAFTIAGGSP